MKTAVLKLTIEGIDWGELAFRGGGGKESWRKGVERKLKGLERDESGCCDVIVQSAVENGTNLAPMSKDKDKAFNHPRFDINFLQTLLYRRFIGCGDTNGRYLMMDDEGKVYGVDEVPAGEDRLLEWFKQPLLETAQTMSSKLKQIAGLVLLDDNLRRETVMFMKDLKI